MKYALFSFLFLAFILSGCSTSQKIVGSWSDPGANTMGPYKKAFVVVLSQNKDANYYIESQIAKLMRSRGF
jgi:PBP1b-binding outer membrane lipoprotein LpoB